MVTIRSLAHDRQLQKSYFFTYIAISNNGEIKGIFSQIEFT